jgi:prepilin peptidase CpaA
MTASLILQSLFVLAVIYGGISDLTTFRIPNLVSYGLVLLFIPYALINWSTLPLLWHVGVGLAFFIPCIVFWQMGWIGAGDTKFMSAIALWLGREDIFIFVVVTTLASLVFVTMLKFLRRWNPYFQGIRAPAVFKQLLNKAEQRVLPYGVPIAIGAVTAVLT